MKQELPNLVDERRFRRREPEQVERDALGRVRFILLVSFFFADVYNSVNGPRRRFPLIWSRYLVSICEPRL